MNTATREIPLSMGKVAIVDDGDYEEVSLHKWHARRLRKTNGEWLWYAVRTVKAKPRHILMHRQILDAPVGMEVDHQDGDGLNNRRNNIRVCTHRQNGMNRRWTSSGKSSKFAGVCRNLHANRSPWKAYICADRFNAKGYARQKYLGVFLTEEEAARAYDRAALEHFREFAVTNFPREQYAGHQSNF